MSALQNQNQQGPRKRRVLNVQLLVGTLIVFATLGPALYCWNYYQTARSAHSYLERADQLESKGELRATADCLYRYLQLYPNDGEVRLRLAKDFDQSTKDFQGKRRAIDLYYQALGLIAADKVPETRIRVAELLLDTQQFTPAQTEAGQVVERSEQILNKNEQDPRGKRLRAQGKRLLAMALYRQHQSGAAINLKGDENSPGKVIEEAWDLNADDRELSLILAQIYREEPQLLSAEEQLLPKTERDRKANQVMDAMIQVHEKDIEALLARHAYRNHYRLSGAEEDLEAAWKLAPQNLDVLLTKAVDQQTRTMQAFRNRVNSDEARSQLNMAGDLYLEAIKAAPADDRAYIGLGEMYFNLGQSDKAIGICKQGLENIGNSIRLNLLLARLLLAKGDVASVARSDKNDRDGPLDVLDKMADSLAAAVNAGSEAARGQKAALELNIAMLRAEWHIKQRQHSQAMPLLKQAARSDNISLIGGTEVFRAWMLLGECYSVVSQWDLAAAAFDEASTLNLQSLQAHKAAAQAWSNLGRFDLTIRHCEQALSIGNDLEIKLLLALARYHIELQKPKNERNWAAFEKALAGAKEPPADSSPQNAVNLKLLEANYILLRGKERGDPETANRTALEKLHEAETVRTLLQPRRSRTLFLHTSTLAAMRMWRGCWKNLKR